MKKGTKKLLQSVLTVFLVAVSSHAATHVVEMRNNFFLPEEITVQAGDTVTWVQRGSNHDTVSYDGLWDSGLLRLNETFSFTFNTAGSFRYFCTPHEQVGMIGTVTVQGGANQPPTVSLTAPSNGATFLTTDSITISANASDDVNVSKVEFFANGNLLGADTSDPYSIAATLAAGSYSITAVATDNASASTTSSAVNITVNAPNQPPTVSLTAPSNGATFLTTDNISISVNASDDVSVSNVEFFANGELLGSDTSVPYSISTTLAASSYSITAVATDNASASTTSTAINITVQAPVNQLPVVTLSSDQAGMILPSPGTVILKATASDADGTISQVEFLNGASSVGVDSNSPYEVTVSGLASGVYVFTAVASDNQNGTQTSGAIQVSVADAPRITAITKSSASYTIDMIGTTDIPHVLEASPDLANWSGIGTNTPAGETASFSDAAEGMSKRFYRVVVR